MFPAGVSMNKWELKQQLEEARSDNTKHTETISKLTTHVQGLWDEIEQKQQRIYNIQEELRDAEDRWKACLLREQTRVKEDSTAEKLLTKHILNKSTDH
jgi:predicted RNase H-like nuclease (RuvC/YqgF family)